MDTLQLDLLAPPPPTLAPAPQDATIAAADDQAAVASMAADWRRAHGVTLTPAWLVESMLDRVAAAGPFQTIVDAGAGSGRFSVAAALRFPQARVLAVENSASMLPLLRQALARAGVAARVDVVVGDFRDAALRLLGRTAFIGNPPFVRHHDIAPPWKAWYGTSMQRLGLEASRLAGLHLHFMARIAELGRPGDHVCLVTAAEWLDNGYGQPWRELLTATTSGLSLSGLWLADPDEPVFPDALVSAAVWAADFGPSGGETELGVVRGRALRTLRRATGLREARRWSDWCQTETYVPATGVELGEWFRITRGQVTGLNRAWVLPADTNLLPAGLLRPTVTRAREIIDGTVVAADALSRLCRVPDLPADLATLSESDQEQVASFLQLALKQGAADGYVARSRRAWHALDLRPPPPAIVSYMGRRPPVFSLNPHAATYLNIAHGLYPLQVISHAVLTRVLSYLNQHIDKRAGRVYGGGMAKFEPSDIARLRIPPQCLEPAP